MSPDRDARGLGALKNATAPRWPEGAVPQSAMMVYGLLRAVHREGGIRFENVPVPGVVEGTTVPSRRAFLVKAPA